MNIELIEDVKKVPESKYNFESLTPNDNVDLDVYEEAINYAFSNPNVRNVAISGAYSSGKSSILASYEKKHNDLRFIHISLAHFISLNEKDEHQKGNDKQEDDRNLEEGKESVLEGKILNQLIHQIPVEKIPQTNFRIKRKVNHLSVILKTLLIVALLIPSLYLISFNFWKSFVPTLPTNLFKSFLEALIHPYALIGGVVFLIVMLCLTIYGLIRIQMNKNIFRKLNLQGNEIEIFEECTDSYFDKYLNEVLYLFENSDADAIVFEDIDRFDTSRIFERLREVNTLVNIRLEKKGKKLRFFYLLRDDIFVSKDRTKFFDYIVPVVPVVDSSNSYDQFITHFKRLEFKNIDEGFLQGLSLYIDDMRLLKNIYNEFLIYYKRLNTTELDCNKMLAIITYKNLFPRDFANLQLNQVFVYTLFSNKSKFIEKEIQEIEETIKENKNRIAIINQDWPISVRELNAIYADKCFKGKILSNKTDDALDDWVRSYLSGDDETEYISRRQALEDKLNGKVDKLYQETKALKQRLTEIKSESLSEIITRDNIDEIFRITSTNEIGKETSFEDVRGSEYFDILKYLIRNGYIDETYSDYMTYFYANSISRNDKTFLRSVTDKKAKDYTYKLDSSENVVLRLRIVDFSQEEILNFDLLTYLLRTPTYSEQLERFLDQLKYTKNLKFISEYFNFTSEKANFVKALNKRWSGVFKTILDENVFSEEQIREYSICSIYHSDDETIKLINQDNCLCDYVSNARDYLAIDNPDIEKLILVFKFLRVRFSGFDYETANKDLFYAVYENSLYDINAENLRLMLTKGLNINNVEDIEHKNYTIMLSRPDTAITEYISLRVNDYFGAMLQLCDENVLDDENVVISALNDSELEDKYKLSYISALQTNITDISKIKEIRLWESLLDKDIVKYSAQNIMALFRGIGLVDCVIDYINRCDANLDFSELEIDEESKYKLFYNVIKCESIKNSIYENILVSLGFGFYCEQFDVIAIPDDKMNILINKGIIKMTPENLELLREKYQKQVYSFIQTNIKDYVKIMSRALFSQDELLEILNWDIDDELKLKLLKYSSEPITVIDKNYSDKICLYILKENLNEPDLLPLFSSFEKWSESVQKKIFECALQNMLIVIDNPNSISEKLKNEIFNCSELDKDEKINLLSEWIPVISKEKIKEILILLNLTEYLKIFDARSRPKFPIDRQSKVLLTAFKEASLIQDYEESGDYYKIIRRKPLKSLV